jgi:uncharacterized protein YfbU (UPF0304 family)
MTLTTTERLILSNQYRILEALYPDSAARGGGLCLTTMDSRAMERIAIRGIERPPNGASRDGKS